MHKYKSDTKKMRFNFLSIIKTPGLWLATKIFLNLVNVLLIHIVKNYMWRILILFSDRTQALHNLKVSELNYVILWWINSSKFTNSKNRQHWLFIGLIAEKNKTIKEESEKQFKSPGCLSNKLYYIKSSWPRNI